MIGILFKSYLRTTRYTLTPTLTRGEECQQKIFEKLIKQVAPTQWGVEHSYKDITSIEDFKQHVSVNSYADLQPYIEKMLAGEPDVLWPSVVRWFSCSSGTTAGKSKYIPVPKGSLYDGHYKAMMDVLRVHTALCPQHHIYNGRGITLGGSFQKHAYGDAVLLGDLSALLIRNTPFLIEKMFRSPSPDIALLPDWEEKLEKMAAQVARQDITNLSGVPSWMLILLKKVLEISGKSDITEVWPNLELFIHGGVNFAPYYSQFRALIPSSKMFYLETYNASEGFFAVQDRRESKDMLLLTNHGIFYEFMPLSEVGVLNPRTYTIGEVEMGVNYAMVITTNGGLCRYLIGDTVMFTSLAPHRIIVTGRTTQFINAFGEELIVDNAERALHKACAATGAVISDYTAAPKYLEGKSKAAHEWVIAFERLPENFAAFVQLLDQELKNENSDYEAKRSKDILLTSPIVHIAEKDTFLLWLKSRGKLGGQHKIPRLSNDRDMIEQILELIERK